MKTHPMFLIAASCTTLCSMVTASAQAPVQASSKPMGYVTYTALGNSDTYIALPVHRKEVFVGKVDSVSASDPSPGSDTITVQGSPGWTAGQFVYSAGVQSDRFYLLITTGDSAGRFYEVIANAVDSVTVDVGVEDITADVVSGTGVKLIPYWTLNTLMPAGAGIHASTSHAGTQRKSEVIIPSLGEGTNLAGGASYYYYSGAAGAGPGWRKAAQSIGIITNDDALAPDSFFIVRHNVSTGGLQPENDGRTQITPIGSVFSSTFRTPLSVLVTGLDQDNAVGLTVPVDVNLTQSNLFESGAFAGSASHAGTQRQDQVLVFDNSVAGKNKVAVSYYYYTGSAGPGPGWRRAGSPVGTIVNDVVFSLDKTVIIRKKGVVKGSVIWDMTPSYLPF